MVTLWSSAATKILPYCLLLISPRILLRMRRMLKVLKMMTKVRNDLHCHTVPAYLPNTPKSSHEGQGLLFLLSLNFHVGRKKNSFLFFFKQGTRWESDLMPYTVMRSDRSFKFYLRMAFLEFSLRIASDRTFYPGIKTMYCHSLHHFYVSYQQLNGTFKNQIFSGYPKTPLFSLLLQSFLFSSFSQLSFVSRGLLKPIMSLKVKVRTNLSKLRRRRLSE